MHSVIAVIIGILTAFVSGSVIGTQVVLASVQSMGLDVTLAMRWSTSLSDLLGLSSSLLPLMAIALGFSWALLIWLDRRRIVRARALWCVVVGAATVMVLHPALNLAFGVDVYAPARSLAGLAGQGLAGALGGISLSRVLGASHSLH
ncbi:MAG: hypothetical protein CBC82_05785 [Cellvibrionales bacterium TMED122]|nr:MAG: hypothetical protein CBC82_05785 [Cellvibrionales bacterium TMED122]